MSYVAIITLYVQQFFLHIYSNNVKKLFNFSHVSNCKDMLVIKITPLYNFLNIFQDTSRIKKVNFCRISTTFLINDVLDSKITFFDNFFRIDVIMISPFSYELEVGL